MLERQTVRNAPKFAEDSDARMQHGARWFVAVALVALACSAPTLPAPARKAEPGLAPLGPQASYCERLQPLLDKTVRAARIGTELACLDVPGITELGRYGAPAAGEEESLGNCFGERGVYESLFESPEGAFHLSIDEEFAAESASGAAISLTHLVPWLPRVEVSAERAARVSASVSIREARFITLVGVASKLQSVEREQQCLQALCKPEYTYVHKALVGIPTVVVTAKDTRGKALEVNPLVGSVEFRERELSRGSREISSAGPVTLAIARSAFRTPQTERLCQFCGKKNQACCELAPACDGGLGCGGERCVPVGGPGQPCDGESCGGGATCVRGLCQLECGGRGQACCAGSECSGKLRCTSDPENGLEQSIASNELSLSGGFFGTDEDQTFGVSSCGALRRRARFAVTKLGSGRGECSKAWWFDPKNERDCRVAVHFNVSTFGSIQCRIEVFATVPPKPDRCMP